jgi:dihydroflavonol-4-reductase
MRQVMQEVNVGGTKNIVTALLPQRHVRLVYMSSVVAVGASFDGTLLNEMSPYTLSSLQLGYFESKHEAEQIVLQAVAVHGLNAVAVNPSTIYGPGDATKASRQTQVKVARGQMPFYTSGGISVIGIEELIDAVITAGQKGQTGQRYILAGENITIQQLFELIANCSGVKAPRFYLPNAIVHGLGRVSDLLEQFGKKGPLTRETAWTATLYHWFDSSKAKKELGLRSQPAARAVEQSVKWMKDHNFI